MERLLVWVLHGLMHEPLLLCNQCDFPRALGIIIADCSSIYSRVCHVHPKELWRLHKIVRENWGPLLVLCHLLSGISCSLSVWRGLESISSSGLMNILRASMWKIVLFPLRTLFPSNLWLYATVSPQNWSWHLSNNMCQLFLDGALFQGVILLLLVVVGFLFFSENMPMVQDPLSNRHTLTLYILKKALNVTFFVCRVLLFLVSITMTYLIVSVGK